MANLLPPNATQLERNIAEVNARLGDLPTPLRDLYIPDACPVEWLPWLAHFFSVDAWAPTWSEAQKRDTIKTSIKVHQLKGTIGAVRRALAAMGFDVRLQEWFNQLPAGAPFTYKLLLNASQVGFSKADLQYLQSVVDDTKNLRSHLSEVVIGINSTVTTGVACVARTGHDTTLRYGGPVDLSLLEEINTNGRAETMAAAQAFDQLVNVTLPSLFTGN